MDDLWGGLVRLLAQTLLAADGPVRIGIDDTAQKKTGAKIYGVGMVYDNRPAAQKGWVLSWGLTWVVMTAMIREYPGAHNSIARRSFANPVASPASVNDWGHCNVLSSMKKAPRDFVPGEVMGEQGAASPSEVSG